MTKWLFALSAALLWNSAPLRAGYIEYQSEIHTGNNILAFYNTANSTLDITRIRVYLGDNANFDLGADFDALLAITTTSPSSPITITHFPFVADDTSATVGLVGAIGSYFADGSRVVELFFNNFNPGEGWGVTVDIDSTTAGVARGADMANLLVSVEFQGGWILTSACNDPYRVARGNTGGECLTGGSGKGRSFPSWNYATVSNVPEPAHGVTVGLIAIGLAAVHQRRAIRGR